MVYIITLSFFIAENSNKNHFKSLSHAYRATENGFGKNKGIERIRFFLNIQKIKYSKNYKIGFCDAIHNSVPKKNRKSHLHIKS